MFCLSAIVNDRTEIVNTAKKEAEGIIRNAEERRNQILSHEEIVVQAQERANEIHAQTQKRNGASACIGCGACASHCPQHLAIPDLLKTVAARFEE